ncbi:MAG: GNAT N-acetyltransferase [Alphaproteobacteria bacterium]|nr:GNAT N-acetyltransferase [Alphaproteobacteria bacterium]
MSIGAEPAPMIVRAATPDDLPRLLAEEARARAGGFILGDDEPTHRAMLADPDIEYRVYLAPQGGWLGNVILRIAPAPLRVIELRRIVVAQPGRGTGTAIMVDVMRHAFATLGAHRLWLDSLGDNLRAHAVYRRLGFTQEGRLRDEVLVRGAYRDVLVFGMLEDEWRRLADAKEPRR